MKKLVSYKLQYYLSLIPFIGLFIAWICSWLNIYRITLDRKYVFIHFCIWLIPMCIAGGILVLSVYAVSNQSIVLKTVVGLIASYISCLILAISCVGISRGVIERYEKLL